MVSCINSLYTNGKDNSYSIPSTEKERKTYSFVEGVTNNVKANCRRLLGIIPPTYKGAEIKIQGISSNALRADMKNLNTHISEKLNELTPSNGISVYAVGIAMEFHCTMVIVSKDPNFKDSNGKSGTDENPIYIYSYKTEIYLKRMTKNLLKMTL